MKTAMLVDSEASQLEEACQTCYIDSDRGCDEESADGSQEQPFKSLAYAYVRNLDRPNTQYFQAEPAPSSTDPARDSPRNRLWEQPTKSAINKAQAVLSRHKQRLEKQQKEEEQRKRDREEALEEALLAYGADAHAVDDYGWSPLHYAVVSGSQGAVTLLLPHNIHRKQKALVWIMGNHKERMG